MKKFVFLFIAALIIVYNRQITSFVNNIIYASPCDSPIEYGLGSVDPRFNITDSQFLKDINEATDIWDKAESKTLFKYNPNADLKVSLVYDQRQALDTTIGNLQNQVQSGKQAIAPEISQYQKLSADYRQKLSAFNSEVDMWNAKGGAPQDVYDRLKSEQQDLKNEANQLNQLADRLNISTNQYNAKVNELNNTIGTFNNTLSLKPEEGLYDPNKDTITIYFDTNHNELIHTLSHEFGHSLGMQHEPDPNAIMYPYTSKTTVASMTDINQLKQICAKQDIFKLGLEKFPLLFRKYSPFHT